MADGRAEVHLHAVLESGEPALVVDDRVPPYFFVRAADARRAPPGGARRARGRDRAAHVRRRAGRSASRSTCRATCRRCAAARRRRRRLLRGRRALRVPLPDRPRHPRRLPRRRPVRAPPGRRARVPQPAPRARATSTPQLRVLSFDIETSPDGRVALLDRRGRARRRARVDGPLRESAPLAGVPEAAIACGAERARVLERFLGHVRAADPDVLTGWNVGDFDLHGPAARRAARRAPADARPHGRRGRAAARPRLHARAAGDPLGRVGARRPRARPQRLRPARRLPARDRGAGAPRQGQALLAPSTAATRSRRRIATTRRGSPPTTSRTRGSCSSSSSTRGWSS